ncbi:hypothetical protein ACQPYE_01005 [Actinosynnema sp. CA-299493]
MSELLPSPWACERFGDLAGVLLREIPRALRRAHRRALAAYVELGLPTNEAYGLIWKVLHEELIDAIGHLPDVRRTRPERASYELAVIGENNVILYPWRYGDDPHLEVTAQRMRLSDVRVNLLALSLGVPEPQLTLEHAELTEEQVADLFEEAHIDVRAMSSAGRTVVVAYASNPHSGVLRVFWGDAEKADDDGRLHWPHIEEIPLPAAEDEDGGDTGRGPVRPITPTDPDTGAARFDRAPLQEPVMGVRAPLTSPDTDPTTPQPGTGSDE